MNEIRNLLIGVAIDREGTQIAVYDRQMRDAECVPMKAGTDLTTFPTALCKYKGKEGWRFGSDVSYLVSRGEGEAVPDLFDTFCTERTVHLDGKEYQPWELLSVYLKEILEFLGVHDVLHVVRALMVTTPELHRLFARNVNHALTRVLGTEGGYSAQDHDESFYYYSLYHNQEIYRKSSVLVVITPQEASLHTMRVERTENGSFEAAVHRTAPRMLSEEAEERDRELLAYLSEEIEPGSCAAVYLTGEGFSQEQYPQSIAFLCRDNRKVFAGDNLYVKGACFAALERAEAGRFKNIRYISPQMLPASISIHGLVDGKETDLSLIAEGTNWFEATKTLVVMPEQDCGITFRIASADGGINRYRNISLDGLPDRPMKTTRLRVTAACPSSLECVLTIEDLGFGGFYPSAGYRMRFPIPFGEPETLDDRADYPLARICTIRSARVPFLIESILVNVYSIEEVCYFLSTYPELIGADIVTEDLADWFDEELLLPRLASELRKALEDGDDLLKFVMPIFREANYFTPEEEASYRQTLQSYVRKPLYMRLKQMGDALSGYGRYVSALGAYRKALRAEPEKGADPIFMQALYHNMGAVYMRMLLYEESLDSFKKAYIRFHTDEALRTYLLAAKIARPRSKYEEILDTLHVPEGMRRDVEECIEEALRYEVPEEDGRPADIVSSLVQTYRSAAGMPFLGS